MNRRIQQLARLGPLAGLAGAALLLAALAAGRGRALAMPADTCFFPSVSYATLGAALADSECDTIVIAAGTYSTNVTIGRAVTITGAGANQTFLDGSGAGRVIEVDNGDTSVPKVVIEGVTIQNGYAPTGGGAGIANIEHLTVRDSRVVNNVVPETESDYSGGGINTGGFVVLENVEISGNTGDHASALMANAPVTMTNVTISGNHATDAAAIYVSSHGSLTISNSTIVSNTSASGEHGGIERYGLVRLHNTLLAGNEQNCRGSVSVESNGYNLDDGNTCGLNATGDLTNTAPLLGPLAWNGGPSRTHALLEGSPAIDAGDPGTCPATDQRGGARPADGDGVGGARCDIGAFELGAIVYRVFLPFIRR